MGLFDFFSKTTPASTTTTPQNDASEASNSPTTTNSTVASPSVPDFDAIKQSYSNQNLANVSYPMVNSNVADENKEINNVEPVLENNVPTEITQSSEPKDLMDVQAPSSSSLSSTPIVESPTIVDLSSPNPIETFEYTDPSKHPVIPTPNPVNASTSNLAEGVRVVTFEPADQQVTRLEDQIQPANIEPQATPSIENSANLESKISEVVVPEVKPIVSSTLDNSDLPDLNNDFVYKAPDYDQLDSQKEEIAGLQQNIDRTVNEASNEFVTSLDTQTPNPVDSTNIEFEDKFMQDPASSFSSEKIESTDALNENIPTDSNVEEKLEVKTETIDLNSAVQESTMSNADALKSDLESNDFIMEDIKPDPVTPEPSTVVDSSSLNSEMEINPMVGDEQPLPSQPAITPEAAIIEEKEDVQIIEESPFKTIGFLGLSHAQPNFKIMQKLTELATKLATVSDEFIIDSAKGYAKSIFDSAKMADIDLTGMYLKPFYASFSDEAELGEYSKFTAVMFSSNSQKIKTILKESDLIIIPEIAGLNNIATLLEVWSISNMYYGIHKPIILLGKDWSNVLTTLKTLFKLNDNDLKALSICENPEDALVAIESLKKEVLNRDSSKIKKIVDLRDQNEEEDLFVF